MPDLDRWPPEATMRRVTGIALAVVLAIFILLRVHDRALDPCPAGDVRPTGCNIVSLELARTPERARALFAAWGPAGVQTARESVYIDFVFIPAYALLFAGLVLAEARRARGGLKRLGLALVVVPFVSAVLDVVENVALLQALANPQAPPGGPLAVAAFAAYVKFALLLVGLGYILAAFLARVRSGPAPVARRRT